MLESDGNNDLERRYSRDDVSRGRRGRHSRKVREMGMREHTFAHNSNTYTTSCLRRSAHGTRIARRANVCHVKGMGVEMASEFVYQLKANPVIEKANLCLFTLTLSERLVYI
jgi:hypothetical protein